MSGKESDLEDRIRSLYRDCQDLAHYISSARREISQMRPNDLKAEKIPRAGQELDAIVQATEHATEQIMEATEAIMNAKVTDANVVSDACMKIFEACSFQDITGQRITKVVRTLEYIEDHLDQLQSAWGPELDDAFVEEEKPLDEDAALLNGPALEGEGIDQDEVDNLFGDVAAAPAENDETTADSADKKKDDDPLDDQARIDALFD